MHTAPAAAAQERDEFRTQGPNKLVTLGGADGKEIESQRKGNLGHSRGASQSVWVLAE